MNCKGCKYWRELANGNGITACHYALDTGKLRESDPEKCDKWEPRDKKGRKKGK